MGTAFSGLLSCPGQKEHPACNSFLFDFSFLFQHFKQLVDELQAKGVGTVSKALTESFKILREVRVLMLVWGTAHPCIAPTSDSTSLRVLQCSHGFQICDEQCAGLAHLMGSWFVHGVHRHQSLARKDQEASRLWPHEFS